MHSYSQIKAMLAITRASLRSILRSPSAVIFSIAFPLIFILVFGFLSSGGNFNIKVALAPNADTTNLVYTKIKSLAELKFITADQSIVDAELAKGRIIALIDIQPTQNPSQPYQIQLTSSAAANPQNIEVIKSILNAVIANINASEFKDAPTIAVVKNEVIEVPGRTYRTIDFILPGQLGFSLLSAGVFGVAFLFFNSFTCSIIYFSESESNEFVASSITRIFLPK